MIKQYSIAEARNHFAAIVHDLEATQPVQITRRGRVVAVLMGVEEYERLTANHTDFWGAYERFRAEVDLPPLQIEPEIFAGVRDTAPGREAAW
ncbi:MAG: type II toxin-antitoxin system Phd/YefM family antitoxin [Caldilinea sp.]